MEGHAKRNLYYHLIALKAKRENYYRRLLMEKLNRLQAREQRIKQMWSE